jgi:hypothetical protein
LRKECEKVGNEASLELDYEEMERELDNRVAARRARAVWLEMEERRQVAEEKRVRPLSCLLACRLRAVGGLSQRTRPSGRVMHPTRPNTRSSLRSVADLCSCSRAPLAPLQAALASQTASVADEMEKLRAKLRGWNIEPAAPRSRDEVEV